MTSRRASAMWATSPSKRRIISSILIHSLFAVNSKLATKSDSIHPTACLGLYVSLSELSAAIVSCHAPTTVIVLFESTGNMLRCSCVFHHWSFAINIYTQALNETHSICELLTISAVTKNTSVEDAGIVRLPKSWKSATPLAIADQDSSCMSPHSLTHTFFHRRTASIFCGVNHAFHSTRIYSISDEE